MFFKLMLFLKSPNCQDLIFAYCIPVTLQGKAAELEDGLKQLSSVCTELEEVNLLTWKQMEQQNVEKNYYVYII